MRILLLADHHKERISDQSLRAITAAREIGGDIHVLVAGADLAPVAESAAKIAGVSKVLHVDDSAFANNLAEPLADLIVFLASNYDTIMAAATSTAKNVLPRIAALLDVMQVSEVVQVLSPNTFKRPIYAGNALQTVQVTDPKAVLTVRAASFPAAPEGNSAPVEVISVPAFASDRSTFIADELSVSERPELTTAKIVVSGGRALGSAEKFREILLPLADKLGAAVGASRAAVDAGYAPNDCQVGQTGKIVSPDLYVAIGISGAIQHLAGMKDAKVIVAINRDGDAPIFDVADYGLVADLFDTVPDIVKNL